jgi:hypothetical protein
MSNTKLTVEQKLERKRMLADLGGMGGTIGTRDYYTVVRLPEFKGSRMAMYSVSVRSMDEIKNRRKVGEYHALNKLFNKNQFVLLPEHIMVSEFLEFLFAFFPGQP